MDIDISKPEGVVQARKYLSGLSAIEALRILDDNLQRSKVSGFERSGADVKVVDLEARTVSLSFSSEAPVERWFGTEILSHDRGAPDLKWLRSGNAPLLWMHDGRSQIGVVESAKHSQSEKRCTAVVRIAKDEEGDRFLNRVNDGIIKNVSFGYRITEWTREDAPDDDSLPTYTATKWRGVEISLVSTPADETVGVGRGGITSFRTPDTQQIQTAPALTSPLSRTTMPPTAEEIAATKLENENARKAAVAAERKRVNTLNALRKRYDADGTLVTDEDFARFADDETKGELEFRQFLETKQATPSRVAPTIGLVTTERVDHDPLPLLHALRGLVFGGEHVNKRYTDDDKRLRALSPSVFKPTSGERSLVTASENVRASKFMPISDPQIRAQNAQSLTAGGAMVGVTFAPEVIEYLRPMPQMQRAGAIVMAGVTGGPGTIRFPKQTGDIYASWAASQVASNPGQLPFGVLDLTPKRLVAQVRIDRQLLLQESFDVEAYCRNSINLQFALSYDLAGMIGNGNGMPLGILNTPNIQAGSVTFNGPSASSGTLAPQFSNFISFKELVLAANAGMLGKRSYITSPQSMMNWASVPKAPNGVTITNSQFMLNSEGNDHQVLGESVFDTTYLNTLPAGYTAAGFTLPVADVVLYGPFNQYMFIEWAGVEWIYDPYTQAAEDLIVLTARLYVDGGCRQPTAFVTSSNAGSVPFVA